MREGSGAEGRLMVVGAKGLADKTLKKGAGFI